MEFESGSSHDEMKLKMVNFCLSEINGAGYLIIKNGLNTRHLSRGRQKL